MGVQTYLKYRETPNLGIVASPSSNTLLNGKLIIAPGLEDILVWNWKTGTMTARWHDSSSIVTYITTVNSMYAVGHADGSVRIWQNNTCTCVLTGHKSPITFLQFSSSGSQLASGSSDTDLVIWDVLAECGLYRLKGHKDQITGIVFLEHEGLDHIVTTSKDCLMKVWDLKTQHCVETIVAHRTEVWALAISEDRKTLFTAAQDNELRVWNIDSKGLLSKLDTTSSEELVDSIKLETTILRQSKERASSIRVHGRFFAVQATDKQIEIFKTRTPEEIRKRLARMKKRAREKDSNADPALVDEEMIETRVPHSILRCSGKVRSFEFGEANTTATSESFMLMCALANNSIEIYTTNNDEKSEEAFKLLSTLELQGHRSDIRCLALSNDDELIASGSNNAVKIWNVATRQCIKTLASGYALCISFVPGNKHIIVGTKSGELQLFELASSNLLETIPAHEGPIWSLQVRPDRVGFATGSADKCVKFWDFQLTTSDTGIKQLTLLHTKTLKMADDVLYLRHSPDDKLVAVSLLDATVKVFFTDTLKFSLSLYGHKLPVLALDISSDSTLIATASADKSVKIWGLDFGDCHRSLLAHTDSVMGIQFVWGTHYFFTTSKDKNIGYWDGDKFEAITKLSGHHGEVWALAIAKFGTFVVTGSHDRSIRIWEKTDEQLFLEEERERETEEMYERDGGRGEDRDTGAFGSGADDGTGDLVIDPSKQALDDLEEVGIAGKKTKETLKSGEKLYEALDVWAEDRAALDAYKEAVTRGDKSVQLPQKSPFIRALNDPNMTPELYVLHVLGRIRAADLEQALIVLPFVKIEALLTCIAAWSEVGVRVQLTTRTLSFIYRLHFSQITSSISASTLAPLIERIKVHNQFWLEGFKDTIGFNMSALHMLARSYAELHSAEFFGERELHDEKAKKGGKKRKVNMKG